MIAGAAADSGGRDARRGPWPSALLPMALPLSWVYGAAVACRNARYDRGHGVRGLPIPTISVGNIVAGGSGKSPMTRWIARTLLALGHRPLIALRGYGATRGGVSDEAVEHADRMPGVPVIVGADRHATISAALADGLDADCAILDDGFQHRQLRRDLDLVLVDGRCPQLDGRLLPAGWLREPASSLRRAHAVIVTHAGGARDGVATLIARHHGHEPVAWVDHHWSGLEIHGGRDDRGAVGVSGSMEPSEPRPKVRWVEVEWLRGRRVVALLGLADPSAVLATASRAGAVVIPLLGRDHERYTVASVERLRARLAASSAEAVLMTGKDWAKVRPLLASGGPPLDRPIVVPRLEIEFSRGREAVVERVRAALSMVRSPY